MQYSGMNMQNIMVGACGTNSNRGITMSLSEGSMKDNREGHRFKYKVYKVINMKTRVKYRISGVGFELPHEPLRNLPLGGVWWGKNNRYERIM